MKFICTAEHLRNAVLTAERFSGRHVTLPILSFIFLKITERKISIIATNLETGLEYVIPGKIIKSGNITAPAKQLAQILQLFPEETITLEARQNQLILHTPASQTTLLGLNPDDFPTLPSIKQEHAFSIESQILIPALQRVIPAAASSTIKPELTGILFTTAPGTLTLAATDSFRLAEKTLTNLNGVDGEMECIVPLNTLRELMRIAPGDGSIKVSLGEHQVVFSWNETRILSRLIDGSFPPYRNIIPKSYETTVAVSREEFLSQVRLAAVFSSRLNDVTVSFSPSELNVSTANSETGSANSRLKAKGRGASGSAMFNYRFLADGLEAAGGENSLLNFNGSSGPTMIQNPDDASYLYLLMPIRSV